jgi:soluble lytic murein transglycosylase
MRARVVFAWLIGCLACFAGAATAAEPTAAQRRAFQAAFEAAQRGPPGRWQALAGGLESYPLYPYLEGAALARDLDRARADDVRRFLVATDGWPVADPIRRDWLRRLARLHQWRDFVSDWRPQEDIALRCEYAHARIALDAREGLLADARALWLHPRSLPTACDPVIAWLRGERALTDELVWQRIRLAAAARQATLVKHLAALLDGGERAAALAWARTVANPVPEVMRAAADNARERERIALGMALLARRDPDRAATLWSTLERRYAWGDERGPALAQIALQKAASYTSDAGAWLARVPDAAMDDPLREWAARVPLARSDWTGVAAAVAKLTPAQQADPRWRWVRARALELGGDRSAADAALQSLALDATFHGFLAADRVDRPYAICGRTLDNDAARRVRIAATPGLVRAFEWRELDDALRARREWDYALRALDDTDRRVAVALAHERRWYDRGPLTLLRSEDRPYYELRFPLAWTRAVRLRAQQNGIDPGVVMGLIRAESAWLPDAHSHANARGLMQLLPANAPGLAKKVKLPYGSSGDLDRPALNIALGTRHLADELSRWGGRLWVAAAAYNAGPAPVQRWLAQRPALPPDLWVETIPYRETREYVARVLAFATLYDWRLGGDAAALSGRMGMGAATRRAVACAVAQDDAARTAGTEVKP